ncbi:H(+)/Cl(-) exchange transporter 7-like [Schistocerca gregaria]|uniref:H(+)/Cl(-) exchange transporter 7-like n=1 Tax=Schistocerca gregaria TaxID=7010 RepID=UPI00211E4E84|nr:H(+)/Cl(-) exchange transporter 7-like [Schistocerca gregaria]
MASIFFLDQKNAFRQVLWNSDSFGNRTLFLFSLVYFLLNTWAVGLSVPHGLLMPTILNGAVIGRLVGNLIGNWFPSKCVQPEMFALIGAASLLGGKSRMTISLTAVLIESTNNIVYAMPLMFTLMVSKWVGDWFGPGIYDSYIEIKGYPFLDWEPHPALYKFKAKQVMGHPVQTFSSRPLVKTVVDTLRKTTHNGFPIVTKSGVLQGLILRTQLLTLLKEKAFYSSVLVRNYYPSVTLESFIKDYPRYDSIENIILTQQEENMRMNLVPYMASNLFVMHQDASMKRLFVAFRSLGLRHLIIVDKHNVVVGIITRKDLFLQRLLEKVREADV